MNDWEFVVNSNHVLLCGQFGLCSFKDIEHQLQENILRYYLHYAIFIVVFYKSLLNRDVFSTKLKPPAGNVTKSPFLSIHISYLCPKDVNKRNKKVWNIWEYILNVMSDGTYRLLEPIKHDDFYGI